MPVISCFDIDRELRACNAPDTSIAQVELTYIPAEEVDGEWEEASYQVHFFCWRSGIHDAYRLPECATNYDMADAMKAYNAVVEAARANLDSEQRREARESKLRDQDE